MDEKTAARFWAKVQKTESCWLWTGACTNDNPVFWLPPRQQYVARILWEKVHGPIPVWHTMRRSCGNTRCVRLEHLFLLDRPGYSATSLAERFWKRVKKGDACWEWQGHLANGYGSMARPRGQRSYETKRVHVISWNLAHGEVPEGMEVCHRCDNRRCVRPDHLFVGTHLENMHDMMRKGRTPNLKLSPDAVREIRRTYVSGDRKRGARALGRRFGVSGASIIQAFYGRTHWHVE